MAKAGLDGSGLKLPSFFFSKRLLGQASAADSGKGGNVRRRRGGGPEKSR